MHLFVMDGMLRLEIFLCSVIYIILIVHLIFRLVSVSRGEQEYFDPSGLATASEGAKSNALMRCCKDLGIASELW